MCTELICRDPASSTCLSAVCQTAFYFYLYLCLWWYETCQLWSEDSSLHKAFPSKCLWMIGRHPNQLVSALDKQDLKRLLLCACMSLFSAYPVCSFWDLSILEWKKEPACCFLDQCILDASLVVIIQTCQLVKWTLSCVIMVMMLTIISISCAPASFLGWTVIFTKLESKEKSRGKDRAYGVLC